jgi:predicted alpha-1,6-mannanase (GH76 family)
MSLGRDAPDWTTRAARASTVFLARFWDADSGLFFDRVPFEDREGSFNFWWMAHGLDVLLDAFKRDGDSAHVGRARELLKGIRRRNAGSIINDYYDDMQWLALACLRAFDAGGGEVFRQATLELWADIQTGWNDACAGGIAWRKPQLDYKNTPANAPAVILAARLHRRFGHASDLEWACRIWAWLEMHLIDPETGFVWDGINRQGDGQIDRDWRFTYCQGVVIGAALELWRVTREHRFLEAAGRTAQAAQVHLSDPATHLMPDEGGGDAGLFKGILVRYLGLYALQTRDPDAIGWLQTNANIIWHNGRDPESSLFGRSWAAPPVYPLDLSAALSGVMLLETMGKLERARVIA